MKIRGIIWILLMVLAMGSLMYVVIEYGDSKDEIRKVSCYDKYNNKITGQTCEVISNKFNFLIGFPILSFMILIIWLQVDHGYMFGLSGDGKI